MLKNIKRGQVWFYVPTVTPSGHIQKGPRPVVIVSNDRINETSTVVLGVPCTTQVKRNFPTHAIFILNHTINIALCEQIMPINVDELVDCKASLENYIMERVDDAIEVALGFRFVSMERPESSPPEFENVNNSVENSNNSPASNQVDKFYSRYPQYAPKTRPIKTKWTEDKINQFIADYERTSNKKDLCSKYGLSINTLVNYYSKFKHGKKE